MVRVDNFRADLAMIRQGVVAVLPLQGLNMPFVYNLLGAERLLILGHVHLVALVNVLALLDQRLALTTQEEWILLRQMMLMVTRLDKLTAAVRRLQLLGKVHGDRRGTRINLRILVPVVRRLLHHRVLRVNRMVC